MATRQMLIGTVFNGFKTDDKSIDFTSASSEYMRSATSTIGIADNWTFQVSFKTTTTFVGVRNVFTIGLLNSANHINLRYRDDAPLILVNIRDSSATIPLTKAYQWTDGPAIGNWQTWTFTWNGTTGDVLTGYLDGVVKTPSLKGQDNTGAQTDTSQKIAFAADAGGSSIMNNVIIHSVAIWNTPLDSSNITEIFNGGSVGAFNLLSDSGNYSQSAALKHWWRLGLDDTDIGKDEVTSGGIDMLAEANNITSADIVTDSPS